MRDFETDSDDFSSTFKNLSLTDDLADFMKLSILMKCQRIQKDIHHVTLGPQSIIRAVKASRNKIEGRKFEPVISQHTNKNRDSKSSLECTKNPLPRTIRNETSIKHMKTITEFESRRLEDLSDSIEKHRQKFIDFEHKQRLENKITWRMRQETMIQSMQQQEMEVKKLLEEHEKEVQIRNKKIEKHYSQLAEKRIKEEQVLNETKKQIKVLVEGISKSQSEFTVIYNNVAEDIRKIDASQRGGFATHVTTLDQLRQQLEVIVGKCKTSSFTLQQKDLIKCGEIIDLANRICKQIQDAISKLEQDYVEEKASPFSLQTSHKQIFNVPQPTPTPLYKPSEITQTLPPMTTFNSSAFLPTLPSTNLNTTPSHLFAQSIPQPQAAFEPPPQIVSEIPFQEVKASPKLDKYVNRSLLVRYVQLQDLLMEKEQVSKQILEDPTLKTFKNNCKKAINTPVNTLTDATPHHLLDKYTKLNKVLSGKTVEISGDRINVGQHPHGIDFCMDLLAKKFVLQGDLIVSSNTSESAFNYASVILSLWNDFPVFGDLLLGHFYRECPYLLPFYPPKVPEQTEEEFAISQRYRFINDELEGQDTFLKRMVGYMRLYAATLVASPKQSHNGVSQQSMAVAWQWLASVMNLQPRVDITAAMLHTFLETVGFKMQQVYGKQFHKLITFLSNEYMIQIKSIDAEGPVNRLELLLEEYAKNGAFSEPQGMLPINFW